jgi:predicted nucleic acid-binding protein
MRPLIDTGVLLSLLDARDSHHHWSKSVAAQQPKGFVSCEAVISELFFHVRSSERAKHAILAMIEADWLRVLPVLPVMRVAVAHVIEKYHPHADYADACLVAMQEQTQAPIWTTDKRDFTRYRSRLSKPLGVVFPS